jgi:large subunit ribosomal protein L6
LVKAKGKLGELSVKIPPLVAIKREGNVITFSPVDKSKQARMNWGTARALVGNAVKGVSEGYKRKLQLQGVGYRAELKGKTLSAKLGHSHDDNFDLPNGISAKVDKQVDIEITGVDKRAVGQFEAEIYLTKPPEPYKAKGVHKEDGFVERKEGKKK